MSGESLKVGIVILVGLIGSFTIGIGLARLISNDDGTATAAGILVTVMTFAAFLWAADVAE